MYTDKEEFNRGGTTPIINLKFFQDYEYKRINVDNDPCYAMGVYANHKKRLLNDWGRQDFCFTSWYRSWVWVRKLPSGLRIWVCASNRGMEFQVCSMEYHSYVNSKTQVEKEFIEWWEDFVDTYGCVGDYR